MPLLTGEAIKRTNARAIDELFAEEAGNLSAPPRAISSKLGSLPTARARWRCRSRATPVCFTSISAAARPSSL